MNNSQEVRVHGGFDVRYGYHDNIVNSSSDEEDPQAIRDVVPAYPMTEMWGNRCRSMLVRLDNWSP